MGRGQACDRCLNVRDSVSTVYLSVSGKAYYLFVWRIGGIIFVCVRAFVRTFSWKTKQDSRAVACSTVRSLKRPLNTISVSRSSSALERLKHKNIRIPFFDNDGFRGRFLLLRRIGAEPTQVACAVVSIDACAPAGSGA